MIHRMNLLDDIVTYFYEEGCFFLPKDKERNTLAHVQTLRTMLRGKNTNDNVLYELQLLQQTHRL